MSPSISDRFIYLFQIRTDVILNIISILIELHWLGDVDQRDSPYVSASYGSQFLFNICIMNSRINTYSTKSKSGLLSSATLDEIISIEAGTSRRRSGRRSPCSIRPRVQRKIEKHRRECSQRVGWGYYGGLPSPEWFWKRCLVAVWETHQGPRNGWRRRRRKRHHVIDEI